MRKIIHYISAYTREVDKKILVLVSFFTATLVFINYTYGLNEWIREKNIFPIKLFAWYTVFLAAFGIPWWITRLIHHKKESPPRLFYLFIFTAPFIFALKLTLDFPIAFSANDDWNQYWNDIVYWPLLVLIILGLMSLFRRVFQPGMPFYGSATKNISWQPYFLMLLIMLPLVALASTQPDFLAMYPRMKMMGHLFDDPALGWWHKLLFELSYGSDFITIEFFFRGFLVLAVARWGGKDVILPMACFYCTIHFGKPLGECISSYFGGILLGIVSLQTRSVYGGLIVHLGIAWMMELGGHIGNHLR